MDRFHFFFIFRFVIFRVIFYYMAIPMQLYNNCWFFFDSPLNLSISFMLNHKKINTLKTACVILFRRKASCMETTLKLKFYDIRKSFYSIIKKINIGPTEPFVEFAKSILLISQNIYKRSWFFNKIYGCKKYIPNDVLLHVNLKLFFFQN